jgi:biopolymer transport protein ExbD
MAKKRNLDVWIVESNTVYQDVPFTVVADWTQEGRLLENDQLRLPGTDKWYPLGKVPALAAYLPRAEPMRAEDRAEALEPVEVEFSWRKKGDEDEDVDMIPLIDISLVLLIFFMMTTTVVVASSSIQVPETQHGSTLAAPGMLWIGIDKVDDRPVYSFGEGDKPAAEEDHKLSEAEVIKKLEARLKGIEDPVEVRITAHRDLPYETVKQFSAKLEPYRHTMRKISKISAEVNEKKP